MTWGAFPPDRALETEAGAPPVRIVAQLTAAGADHIIELSAEEPEYTWHDQGVTIEDRFLPVPQPPQGKSLVIPLLSVGLWVVAVVVTGYVGRGKGWRAARGCFLVLVLPALVGGWLLRGTGTFTVRDPLAAGVRLPDEIEALAVFTSLHANIYRAFAYHDASDIYDALARSVHGDLLDRLYDQIYQSLILQEEGGAVCRVEAVRTVDHRIEHIGLVSPEQTVGFNVLARWQVDGSVFHWGHSHRRTNEYQARYAVVQTVHGWRLGAQQVLEQLRVDGAIGSFAGEDPRREFGGGGSGK
jgi:hypothetical protein